MSQRRLFIVDHMCVLPYGHNLNSLILFKKKLESRFSEIQCLATKQLPTYAEQSVGVERVLNYPYAAFVPPAPAKKPKQKTERDIIDDRANFADSDRAVVRKRRLGEYFELAGRARKTADRLRDLATRKIARDFFAYDYTLKDTIKNWGKVFSTYAITSNDTILFPSADHYGTRALIDFLSQRPEDQRPKIHLRMIGVMESAMYSWMPGRPEFLKAIRQAQNEGIRVTLSAETPVYVQYLERLSGMPVAYLPYPLAHDTEALHWKDTKVIASPGQGRADKGFFRLFPIIIRMQQLQKVEGAFRYIVQNMRDTDTEYRLRYESLLRNVPGLTLLKARLKQEEIDQTYKDADILLLPYDPEVYALRGSAVYQEGLAVGRLFACSTAIGVSDLIERYGNGLLATSESEFAEKLVTMSEWSREEVARRTKAAREAYEHDFSAGLDVILAD